MAPSSSRPHVALVSDADGVGGAELYLELLVGSLRDRYRFTALLGDRTPAEVEERLGGAGASVERVHGLRRYPTLGAVVRLRRRLGAIAPDLAHVNLTDQGGGIGALIAARLAGTPTVATLHLVIPGRSHMKELLSSRLVALPHVVISVSRAVAAYASRAARRTVVVYPAVPEPSFADEPRAELGLERDAFVIGGIGRLHDQKGWDVLCDASQRIHAELPGTVLAVVGDGPERASLAGRAGREGVRFLGHRENASSLVRAFDVLVVPSRYEAFGLVVLEALHAGVPVVASEAGGLPEVVGSCGILVPPEDSVALAQAIVDLARDPEARAELARDGVERARTAFSVERMGDETARVYESLRG